MFFNLMSMSFMVLIGLSNQYVLGRFITGPFSLSKHNGASGGNSPGRTCFSKIDNSRERCHIFFSVGLNLRGLDPRPTVTPALPTPNPDSSEKDRDRKNKKDIRTDQILKEKHCILIAFLSFMLIFGPIFIHSFPISRKDLMSEGEVGNRNFGGRQEGRE